MADPNRHIRKKRLRDLSYKIRKTELRLRNKKAKRDIPRLEADLQALRYAYDQTLRGILPGEVRKVVQPKLCRICNEKLGKGYHICKPRHLIPRHRAQTKSTAPQERPESHTV